MKTKIETVLYLIQNYMENKLAGRTKQAGDSLRLLTEALAQLLPEVIACYEKPELAAVRQDAEYWVSQLGRIVEALEGGDDLKLIDVLYYETAQNLKEFASLQSA